jgi:hypothetical protein
MAEQAKIEDDLDTPSRMLDDEGLFARLKAWFQTDWDKHHEWVEAAREDFDFVASKQWTDAEIEALEEQNRPTPVFNRVAPVIDSVTGFEVANRQETQYIPRKLGAAGVNQMLTSAAHWFRDQCDAEDEESDAFRDTVISGLGWLETRIDYETNPDGDPRIERVDPTEICANAEAVKPNLVDAKRIWRLRKMDRAEAAAMFPEADESILHAGWATYERPETRTNSPVDDYDHDESDEVEAECVIVECQWWEREPFVRYIDGATGDEVEVSLAEFSSLMERLEAMGPEMMMMLGVAPPANVVHQHKRVYRRAFIGTEVIETGFTPVKNHFTYKAITGKRDQNSGRFYGLVRAMKDPQRWTNKLFSQIMHILNSNAKGGIMAEHGAFEDDRQAAEDYARADGIVFTNPGAITAGKIMPKPATPFPEGQAAMLQFAMGAMPLVTGVNMEFLGMREANQPGVLEQQRKQSGVTILATLFDSLRRYRKEQGRLMLGMIQEYLSDGRLVKIVGDEFAQYLPLDREQTLGEFEVVVDEAPNSPNAKERNWGIISGMLPLMQSAMTPQLMAELTRYSPLPDSINEIIRQTIMKPPEPPSPDDMMIKQLTMAGKLADIDKDAAAAEKSRADAMARQAAMMAELAPFMGLVNPDLPSAPVPSGPIPGMNVPMGAMTPDAGMMNAVPPGDGPGMSQPPMPSQPVARGPGMPQGGAPLGPVGPGGM